VIGRLEGCLQQLDPGTVLIDTGGVGYLVSTTLRSWEAFGTDDHASLWIHTNVRDDAIVLFGFPDRNELGAFERLIGISGVGPRIALAVLSGMSPGQLAEAVEKGDFPRIQRTPGVGRKTAERIVLELKGRLDHVGGGIDEGDPALDAISALVNLGYSERDASRAVNAARPLPEVGDLGSLIRQALQILTG